MRGRGRFISLEGGEGTGKSTQARILADWLRGLGVAVIATREPGGSPRAEALRELLLLGRVAPFGPAAEALFFAVARREHLSETIAPALDDGLWVISDRFLDSTRAYQGPAGVSADCLDRLDAVSVGDLRPDLTLVLDLPPELAMMRLQGRGGTPDRFEADDAGIHSARREAFLQIAAREPTRCVVIDASLEPDDVAQAIKAAVTERLLAVAQGAR